MKETAAPYRFFRALLGLCLCIGAGAPIHGYANDSDIANRTAQLIGLLDASQDQKWLT